ncbi:hypothetical protein [Archangium sp.]|uniref:hypothetical protein n=1 Tax=Archangium sp. TaxID=1872627 RepID=UPI002D68764D|nr:hypothetical protein [Archangium sp.]HYO52017.1 hypothetical protein [Archangium sp.]
MARNAPDEYAWQLFLALNRQAQPGVRGVADPYKPFNGYEQDKPVVWETWAHASGGRQANYFPPVNYSEVFLDHGARPPLWDSLSTTTLKTLDKSMDPHEETMRAQRSGGSASLMDPGSSNSSGMAEEVTMNRATYDTILKHELYSIEGLEANFYRAQQGITFDFPAGAQEVKAKWARISELDKPRYHWRVLRKPDGRTELWGLTALHIITRDLPNWFWATWEHEDYLKLPVHSLGMGLDKENAEFPSMDSTTRGPSATSRGFVNGVPVDGVRRETVGTKWQFYRLRGTQIDYVDANGNYTLLANTQLERRFQQTSSCITCHARASVGVRTPNADGTLPKMPNILLDMVSVSPVLVGPVGKEDPRKLFYDSNGRLIYGSTQFVWSPAYRALSKYW